MQPASFAERNEAGKQKARPVKPGFLFTEKWNPGRPRVFYPSYRLCYLQCVKTLSGIRRLLAILAIVGLAVGPVARPAMALPAATQAPAASDQPMAVDAAMAMPEDMPCCPTNAPVPDCGKDCLFMAMCATQFLSNAVQAAGLVIPLVLANILFPGNDTGVAGLSQGPPPRPPKI
jgi:hypothetical protein